MAYDGRSLEAIPAASQPAGLGSRSPVTTTNSIIDGQGIEGVRLFHVAPNTTVTIQNLTITGAHWEDGNDGGGITNEGILTVANSTISNNRVGDGSGAGGILNDGSLTVVDSTISHNSAGAGDGSGGITNNGTLTIVNSTVSNNAMENGSGAGGIANHGVMTVTNSTISHNMLGTGTGAGGLANNGTLTLDNSIIANSAAGRDCVNDGGVFNDNGNNLIEDAVHTCGLADGLNNNIIGQDPLLGPLQDNGGDTFTHALLQNSPAINAGDTTLTSDQRGTSRPQNGPDDIGAYELVTHTSLFFPMVVIPGYADLQVELVSVTGDADVEIVIRNHGSAAVTTDFRIDLYVGLHITGTVPAQVNDVWSDFSPYGAVWVVKGDALPLGPGDSATLRVGDEYFDGNASDLSTLIAADTPVYVQVDSVSLSHAYGKVLEGHELNGSAYNNVFGPITR